MIDLHIHTTASDGSCTPLELIAHIRRAGIRTFAVTDHDSVAAVPEAIRLASDAELRCIPGIEITAVHESKDVHVLGYFIDIEHMPLLSFWRTAGVTASGGPAPCATGSRSSALPSRFGLAVTGGSDFHGPGTRRAEFFGKLSLPQAHYDDLLSRAGARALSSA